MLGIDRPVQVQREDALIEVVEHYLDLAVHLRETELTHAQAPLHPSQQPEAQRNIAISTINGTLDSLLGTANTQFRGRYLFAGSQTSQIPFSFEGNNIAYRGDAGSVQSYADIGVLFSHNAPGLSVFGGVSAAVVGSVDLNPPLSEDTLLSSLRGGDGIKANGALSISDVIKLV